MPIQLNVFERRDNADREALADAAMAMCRASRAREGITSSRFYWHRSETIVFLTEGEAAALDTMEQGAPEDFYRAGFALFDLAREIINWRLLDPRVGEKSYRAAGR